MLQIATGKFFAKEDCYETPGQGILYSNVACSLDIETSLANVKNISFDINGINTYLISYIEKMEKKDKPASGTIVATGSQEIINQFKYILTFAFERFFEDNKERLYIATRGKRIDAKDRIIPSKFVRNFFDKTVYIDNNKAEEFALITDLIRLMPRERYEALISCLKNFYNALQVLTYNIDLSYTMFVFCLESLSPTADDYTPTWQDYPEEIRTRLEWVFEKLNTDNIDEIKNILLLNRNIKLQKRFISFIKEHTDTSFFIEEAEKIKKPLEFLSFEEVLKNIYQTRSKYAHGLKNIQEHLKDETISSFSEIIHWEGRDYLTLAGLLRLTHHVIKNFILKSQCVEKEIGVDWFNKLDRVINWYMAPEYWIWKKPTNLLCLNKRLISFCDNVVGVMNGDGNLINMKEVLEYYQQNISNASCKEQLSIISLYYLYNKLAPQKDSVTDWEEFANKYFYLLQEHSMQSLTLSLIIEDTKAWNIVLAEAAFQKYLKQRYKKNNIRFSNLIEVSVMIEIANKYLAEGMCEKHKDYLEMAILNAPGNLLLQNQLRKNIKNRTALDYRILLFPKRYFLSKFLLAIATHINQPTMNKGRHKKQIYKTAKVKYPYPRPIFGNTKKKDDRV